MRNALLALLAQHSYKRADKPIFPLSSGSLSDTYINCKATTTLAEAGRLIGEVCWNLIPPEADSVGGLTMGADAIASAVSAYCYYVKERRVHTFVVRKTPKDHGLRLYVEGNPGSRAVVVDDVVTTGGSTITAIQRCREQGIKVLSVIILVDREESDGLAKVRAVAGEGVPVHSIFKKSEIEEFRLSKQACDVGHSHTHTASGADRSAAS